MPRCGHPLHGKPKSLFLVTISISAIVLTVYVNSKDNLLEATGVNLIVGGGGGADGDLSTGATTEITKPQTATVFVVTPTYTRATQMADMTRLAQTLRLVPNMHWLVVEDAVRMSKQVASLLNATNVNYTHILGPTPGSKKLKKYGKGVASRRKALQWIRDNADQGVLYFADDDNAYDIRIFEEMRSTVKVSVWPVGLIFGYGMSTPLVSNGKVIGFHDSFTRDRVFPMDMAGFAVSIEYLKRFPNATMEHRLGYLEDSFLRSLNITMNDLEPKANNCTEVLVWHTKTLQAGKPKAINLRKVKNYNKTNLLELYRNLMPKW